MNEIYDSVRNGQHIQNVSLEGRRAIDDTIGSPNVNVTVGSEGLGLISFWAAKYDSCPTDVPKKTSSTIFRWEVI